MSTANSLALDRSGNLYFTDDSNQRIREITTSGLVFTVAGNGNCGTTNAGVKAAQAPLCDVESVAVDGQGRVFFASEAQVWMIAADGTLVLAAGTGGFSKTGDNGPATAAQIGYPGSLALDTNGDVYIADQFNFVIREVTTDKVIHTVVTINDNTATTVTLATDPSGTLYYASGTKQISKLVSGLPVGVATLTGVSDASYLAVDASGAVYASSMHGEHLGVISTIAGPQPGYNGEGIASTAAAVGGPVALATDSQGNVYVNESSTQRIRKLTKVSGPIPARRRSVL